MEIDDVVENHREVSTQSGGDLEGRDLRRRMSAGSNLSPQASSGMRETRVDRNTSLTLVVNLLTFVLAKREPI